MTAHPATRPEMDATGAPHGDPATLPTASTSEASPEPASGADLARIALRRAQADAMNNPVPTKRKRAAAPRRATGADGRDPNPLGGIISQLVVDNQWEGEAAGADLKQEWPSLLGATRAAHWEADAFDEATGTLRVLCDSASWAANLRLLAPQVIAEVNEKFEAHQKRKTSPLRRLDVQLRSGRSTASPRDVATPASDTPAPALRKERAAEPTAEYRQERARQAEARAVRKAAGEPACPQPSTASVPPLRPHHGDAPSAEYREQRERIRRTRGATHDQVLALARNERSAPAPDAFHTYAS